MPGFTPVAEGISTVMNLKAEAERSRIAAVQAADDHARSIASTAYQEAITQHLPEEWRFESELKLAQVGEQKALAGRNAAEGSLATARQAMLPEELALKVRGQATKEGYAKDKLALGYGAQGFTPQQAQGLAGGTAPPEVMGMTPPMVGARVKQAEAGAGAADALALERAARQKLLETQQSTWASDKKSIADYRKAMATIAQRHETFFEKMGIQKMWTDKQHVAIDWKRVEQAGERLRQTAHDGRYAKLVAETSTSVRLTTNSLGHANETLGKLKAREERNNSIIKLYGGKNPQDLPADKRDDILAAVDAARMDNEALNGTPEAPGRPRVPGLLAQAQDVVRVLNHQQNDAISAYSHLKGNAALKGTPAPGGPPAARAGKAAPSKTDFSKMTDAELKAWGIAHVR